ncbi:MAG: hypothetical protein KatS3mg021_1324 [Fimbriimonadales bacterium]|jgi:hypothetical protein|nr:MAG: hypothetical protein KatS3mg021_1324 [Fimbriimonadales bacterium]
MRMPITYLNTTVITSTVTSGFNSDQKNPRKEFL